MQEMSQSWSVLLQRLQERAGPGDGPTIADIREAIDLRPISNRLDIIEGTSR